MSRNADAPGDGGQGVFASRNATDRHDRGALHAFLVGAGGAITGLIGARLIPVQMPAGVAPVVALAGMGVALALRAYKLRRQRSATCIAGSQNLRSHHLRPTFSLRSLLLGIMVVSAICALVTTPSIHRYRLRTQLLRAGARMTYEPDAPTLWRYFFGDRVTRYFGHVSGLFMHGKGNDDLMGELRWFSTLQELDISGSDITDEGLDHLQRLKRLRSINVSDTSVTGAGLERLFRENRMIVVYAWRTAITPAEAAEIERAYGVRLVVR